MQTIQKIQKVTERGQITLPVAWRKKTQAGYVEVESKGNSIVISPIHHKRGGDFEYTVFDALRDNKGSGLKASELQKILKKING